MTRPAGAVELTRTELEIGLRRLTLVHPRRAEDLLDEEAFEHEEYLPYWAELWPSGLELARVVAARRELAGLRVLELGCGLGVPSLAAALGGADVLAADWSVDAVECLGENAARNGAELETLVCSWEAAAPLVERAPWDVVLAADVLYERRHVEPLAALLPRLVDGAGEILVADPGRPAERGFLAAVERRWAVSTRTLSVRPSVRLHRLRLR